METSYTDHNWLQQHTRLGNKTESKEDELSLNKSDILVRAK